MWCNISTQWRMHLLKQLYLKQIWMTTIKQNGDCLIRFASEIILMKEHKSYFSSIIVVKLFVFSVVISSEFVSFEIISVRYVISTCLNSSNNVNELLICHCYLQKMLVSCNLHQEVSVFDLKFMRLHSNIIVLEINDSVNRCEMHVI